MAAAPLSVGMAEIRVIKGYGTLCCAGLGSGIAVCAFDLERHVGGIAHVMLPFAIAEPSDERPAKFAEHAVPALVARMEQLGAERDGIRVVIVGGAHVFELGACSGSLLDLGARNVEAVLDSLEKEGLNCADSDTGGNMARTVTLDVATGEIAVKVVNVASQALTVLGGIAA